MIRILSLDNEPQLLDLYHLILGRAGYEHISTTDNQAALAVLRREPIDLFTQNLMRPNMDGWEFLRIMQADRALGKIPVLLITTQLLVFSIQPATMPLGYLAKPFTAPELLRAVEKLTHPSGSFAAWPWLPTRWHHSLACTCV